MGDRMPVRDVMTEKDADHFTVEMFATVPEAGEFKMLELNYSRKKPAAAPAGGATPGPK